MAQHINPSYPTQIKSNSSSPFAFPLVTCNLSSYGLSKQRNHDHTQNRTPERKISGTPKTKKNNRMAANLTIPPLDAKHNPTKTNKSIKTQKILNKKNNKTRQSQNQSHGCSSSNSIFIPTLMFKLPLHFSALSSATMRLRLQSKHCHNPKQQQEK